MGGTQAAVATTQTTATYTMALLADRWSRYQIGNMVAVNRSAAITQRFHIDAVQ